MIMISVVIPVYKVEKFLPQCMDTLLKQSYHDMDIILVDDGSPDSCGAICDEYARRDARIRVVHRKNGGLSAARNSGIDIATGEYITFIDSDDFLLPGILEHAVELAGREGADMVSWRHIRCGEDQTPEDIFISNEGGIVRRFEDAQEKMKYFLAGQEIGTVAWGKLYRTALFSDIRYPVGKYHEDVYTTYQLVHKAAKIVTTTETGYVYRKTGGSITTEGFSERRLDSIEGKLLQAEFIKSQYPDLCELAYCGVVYSCNQCLIQMGKSHYRKAETLAMLQRLYRKYGIYYLRTKRSYKGRIFSFAAMLQIKLALWLAGMF
ncbi:MAG: glycosyltransferase [Clostridium sp.]|jgi:glycosyltransferase involved in cell wall biosynthesis|nr:glycosyltransferase [Clostridium sp.]